MKYRCRILLIFLSFLIQLKTSNSNLIVPLLAERPKTKIEKILDYHLEFANELYRDSLITVNPNVFAKMLLVMTYCESGLDTAAISKDGHTSHGIYQFTKKTRKYLNIPDNITNTSIKQQNQYYRRYIEMVGKSKTRRISNLVDLHAMNYTPKNMFNNILSSKGTILVRSDLIEFHKHRVKECKEIQKIYNSL